MFAFGSLERMEKELAVTYFKMLSKYLPEELRKPTKNLQNISGSR
jgi:hypothetical protein